MTAGSSGRWCGDDDCVAVCICLCVRGSIASMICSYNLRCVYGGFLCAGSSVDTDFSICFPHSEFFLIV